MIRATVQKTILMVSSSIDAYRQRVSEGVLAVAAVVFEGGLSQVERYVFDAVVVVLAQPKPA